MTSSFLQISLETANKFYTWGWYASLAGAAVTLIGVSLLLWGTRVRDHDFETKMTETIAAAAQANERAAVLTKQAADVQLELERERIERLKLEAQISPRTLTEVARGALADQLRAIPKPVRMIVRRLGDQEAKKYVNEILAALTAAGVEITIQDVGYQVPPEYGVVLGGKNGDLKSSQVGVAFLNAGIPAKLVAADLPAGVSAFLSVGLKPLQ